MTRWVLLGILCLSAAVRAEIMVAVSLEWLTVDAPVIVRGTAVTCIDTVDGREIVIRVEEVVKGQYPLTTASVTVALSPKDRAGLAPAGSRHHYLFFLREFDDAKVVTRLGGFRFSFTEPQQAVIDLQQPQYVYMVNPARQRDAAVPNRDRPIAAAPGLLRRARDAGEILAVVKRWHDWKYRPTTALVPKNARWRWDGVMRLEITDPLIFHDIWAGSICYLLVPAGEEFLPLALELTRSREISEREQGAYMLGFYPGQASVARLAELLADDGRRGGPCGLTDIAPWHYTVRRAAYASLLALGEHPKEPSVENPPTLQDIVAYQRSAWQQAAPGLLGANWVVKEMTVVEAPVAWKRVEGGPGFAVTLHNPDETIQDPMVGPYHPSITFYLMPLAWQGESRDMLAGKITRQGFVAAERLALVEQQVYPARYLGHDRNCRLFRTIVGGGGWNGDDRVANRLSLKIDTVRQED